MPASPFPISPLTGPLDTASPPSLLPFGTWRWRQNLSIKLGGKLARSYGWQKLLGQITPYQNQDLHDQLAVDAPGVANLQTYYDETSPATPDSSSVKVYPSASCGSTLKKRTTGRQPITLLTEAISATGTGRYVIAGTQNRLYLLLAGSGNWRILSDAYGGTPLTGLPERRWQAAQVNDAVIFTNGHEKPIFHLLDQPVQGCAMQAVATIPSLDAIGLSTAGTVFAWKGFIFLGDVTMDGVRVPHRVVWSGVNDPVGFDPAITGGAGFQDLASGEKVLRYMDIGDYLYIFTTRSIWQVTYTGSAAVFSFYRKFTQQATGDACLAFPNTLKATATGVLYCGRDSIYAWDQYASVPLRIDWIQKGAEFMFKSLDPSKCEAHVGHFHSPTKEYLVSWVEREQSLPSWTLHVNTDPETPGCHYEDYGATAFLSATVDSRPSIEQFVKSMCICTAAELAAMTDAVQPTLKQGTNCTTPAAATCTVNTSVPVWTYTFIDRGDGVLVEDYFQPKPDANTLCSYLNTLDIDAICSDCNQAPVLICANAVDYCLKQNSAFYYRERCTSFLRCGTYVLDGYDSILRTGPIRGKTETEIIRIERLEVIFQAEAQLVPSDLALRVGWSALPDDPNSPTCTLRWRQMSSRPLDCHSTPIAKDQRPFKPVSWPMVLDSQCLYLELKITGTGGGVVFSGLTPFMSGKVMQNFA